MNLRKWIDDWFMIIGVGAICLCLAFILADTLYTYHTQALAEWIVLNSTDILAVSLAIALSVVVFMILPIVVVCTIIHFNK